MTPFSLLVHRRFGETYSFQFRDLRINHVTTNQRKLRGETWTLLSGRMTAFLFDCEMEAALFPETSVNFYHTTRYHIPEDSIIHNHGSYNLVYNFINVC